MKIFIIFIFSIFYTNVTFTQTDSVINVKDIEVLTGSWYGSLTYLDYSTNKPYTMPADVDISRIPNENKFIFKNSYPDEPAANSADTVILSADGKMIGNEKVKSLNLLDNGNKEIITEYNDVDGNDKKNAVIRHIYLVSKDIFIIRKDVKFEGESEWIKRHEYSYKRTKP